MRKHGTAQLSKIENVLSGMKIVVRQVVSMWCKAVPKLATKPIPPWSLTFRAQFDGSRNSNQPWGVETNGPPNRPLAAGELDASVLYSEPLRRPSSARRCDRAARARHHDEGRVRRGGRLRAASRRAFAQRSHPHANPQGPGGDPLERIAGCLIMARSTSVPTNAWPCEMRAEKAAGYCDEPSVAAFTAKVKRGIYSQPVRERGCLPKWHRNRLDQDIARRHGLDAIHGPEDVSGLI